MSFDDIKESAAMAVATVRANKLRSALTILGVGIGVVTLTFMVSIIQGLNKAFATQIESLGSNTIFVSKFDPSFGRPPNNEELHRKDITFEDAEAIRTEGAENIDSVAPIRRKIAADLRYADKETETPTCAAARTSPSSRRTWCAPSSPTKTLWARRSRSRGRPSASSA
jgi:putative ABC transport system permease protein